ncbi:preprotein translocase subunit YidC [Thermotomaculum hydrothermale]|uniref:Membrane protein insertase YidC n=1 Tax=Thermotomaculum hydrothermale TaxID=981385 RepID=A0A7R6PGU8_9BACT|nr:membrane protein insertase YidC [Thermotomaculum hydrothermale]BBB33484.1 preprotein translocase subunit YidC [Thermotomaculum hydrothermale]
MEKRTVIAIVLAIVFIIAWQKFVVEKYMPKKPIQGKKVEQVEKKNLKNDNVITDEKISEGKLGSKENLIKDNLKTEEKDSDSLFFDSNQSVEERDFVLENDLIKVVFTNKGGVAKSIILKKYKEKSGQNYDLVNKTIDFDKPFAIYQGDNSLEKIIFHGEKDGNTLIFTYSKDGKTIKKVFKLNNDYTVDFSLEGLKNAYISLGAGLNSSEKAKSRYSTEDEIAYYFDGDVERISKKKIKKEKIPVEAKWVAIENRYFAKILTPEKGFKDLKPELYSYKEGDKTYSVCSLKASLKGSFKGKFYLGPKEYERLGALGKSYKELVNFGWFGAFGKWLFILLKWINKFVGNWGWSIVIFTILVRIVLFPLNSAGLKSAQKMKDLQPKVKAIQEKYKKYGNDMTMKAKMNQELQELYKKEGVNPLGGCLPMLIQIPIFFAIYSLLLNIIDLRMAPWIGWIKDLSAHDPYFVLPIAMGVTQLIVQLLTPATGDKNQQRMMLIMPIVITFVLIYAPSGLLLYWTTNNIFQIFQQLILNKQMKMAA